jgi:hypothetical protein
VLSTEDAVAFVDIRSKESAKQYGDPNLSSVKKPILRVPFTKVGPCLRHLGSDHSLGRPAAA